MCAELLVSASCVLTPELWTGKQGQLISCVSREVLFHYDLYSSSTAAHPSTAVLCQKSLEG